MNDRTLADEQLQNDCDMMRGQITYLREDCNRLKQKVEQLREACGRASGWLMSLPPHTIGHCIGEQCQQALKETEL